MVTSLVNARPRAFAPVVQRAGVHTLARRLDSTGRYFLGFSTWFRRLITGDVLSGGIVHEIKTFNSTEIGLYKLAPCAFFVLLQQTLSTSRN